MKRIVALTLVFAALAIVPPAVASADNTGNRGQPSQSCQDVFPTGPLTPQGFNTVGFAHVVDGHHVRMRQRRRGSRLSLESPPRVGVGQMGGQNLERDGPGEPGIVRFVDFTHAARSDVRDDFVGTETGAGAEHGKVDYARSRTS